MPASATARQILETERQRVRTVLINLDHVLAASTPSDLAGRLSLFANGLSADLTHSAARVGEAVDACIAAGQMQRVREIA